LNTNGQSAQYEPLVKIHTEKKPQKRLPLSWFLFTLVLHKPVAKTSGGMDCSIINLFCMLMLVFFSSILAFIGKRPKWWECSFYFILRIRCGHPLSLLHTSGSFACWNSRLNRENLATKCNQRRSDSQLMYPATRRKLAKWVDASYPKLRSF